MDKVKGQKYLYIRNGMFYFRVVIPKKYRWYFQKTEIRKSLDTSNLRHGISLACEETSSYRNQLKALDEPVQADNSPAVVYCPLVFSITLS